MRLDGKHEPGDPLAVAAPGNSLYADWLADGAAAELAAAGETGLGNSPWFASGGLAAWADTMLDDAPAAERGERSHLLDGLAQGRIGVVVTGQQPGYGGGPLLTCYKIATAVALARRLTSLGQPTVPVFWSGDDDDDLREAFDVLAPDAAGGWSRGATWKQAGRGDLIRRRLGTLGAETWLDYLPEAHDGLALKGVIRRAVAEDASWRTLSRRLVLAAFAGCGLMVVSGDDPAFHGAAAEFYGTVKDRRRELAELARLRGAELEAGGGHAQLEGRSLTGGLYRTDGSGRAHWNGDGPLEASGLRPGVLLRSPLQDAMLAPRAVVVGPGELAYLRQLETVYAALGIRRCPLVPRLAAWLVPRDLDPQLMPAHVAALQRGQLDEGALSDWLAGMDASLQELLREKLGVDAERATRLAGRRRSRWDRSLRSLWRGERALLAAAGPRGPEWVFPEGRRQERTLAWAPMLMRGGLALRDAIIAAAADHLESGSRGRWQQWEWRVHEPNAS